MAAKSQVDKYLEALARLKARGEPINNDAVDGSMRGYTDINAGVHFVYPFSWGDTVTFNHDDGTTSKTAATLKPAARA